MIPETMKAMLLTGHGGPDKLVLDESYPVPVVEPGEVLVKVGACGINNTDIWVREGAYGSSDDPDEVASFGDSLLQFPLVQGADIVGTIAACGKGVQSSRLGERVMTFQVMTTSARAGRGDLRSMLPFLRKMPMRYNPI